MTLTLCCICALLSTLVSLSQAYRYDPAYVQYNLNQNKTAIDPLDYWGEWTGHEYTPSPTNWRFPFYTLFLDRFVNGDPTNDDINGTAFEHDLNSNQMRHGGDLQGLVDTLDYIQGMGIKGLYIAGSPFINQPWGYDQYSPLDLSILDLHFGTIKLWRSAIDEIHSRGMYVILDNTFATLGDLIGSDGYLNATTPFTLKGHKVQWKTDRHYWDFDFGNTWNDVCNFPPFWNETGFPVEADVTDRMTGCYDSDFDQFGDTEAFGVYPDWRRELSKFASVQDRLREWHTPVRAKLENFYCMMIAQLDIDGYRYDKATQSTVDAMGYMNDAMRKCARRYGKENFFTPGEITGGNDFGSIFIGRGRQPNQVPSSLTHAASLTTNSPMEYFLREPEYGALDSAAFHYTVYRSLTRFLGMDGNLAAGYDAPIEWVDQWNAYLITNDFINANTGKFDPRHMYGVTNQDVFRWPGITNGLQRQLLGHFVTNILMPGVPLILWGEEQAFYVLDSTADNYIFGRQAMSTATAWQMHGCYHLGSTQYYQMPLDSARRGCEDNTVSYDHRDPSAPVRNILRHMFNLREAFPVLNDGFYLQSLSKQTWSVLYPGSSGVVTETGMWSVLRSELSSVQDLSGETNIWLVYSNLNASKTYSFNCQDPSTDSDTTALISPFSSGTTVKNLFYPYDEHTLTSSKQSLGFNGSTSANGCLDSLDMQAYDFRAYVPVDEWVGPAPMITKFSPGHDARILSTVNPFSTETVDVELQFSVAMDCDSVTQSISFTSKTDDQSVPKIDLSTVNCGNVPNSENSTLVSEIQSTWAWNATITGVANGVHRLTVNNATAADGKTFMNSVDRFLFRVGQANNPIVFPRTANYSTTLLTRLYDGKLYLNHSAAGADQFRYSTNFMSSFSDWMTYEGGTQQIHNQPWSGTSLQAWKGEHVRVEYYSRLGGSSDTVQEADLGSKARRFPHLFLNGPYNSWGFDAGLDNEMTLTDDYTWTHHWMVEWSKNGSIAQANVWGMDPDGMPDQTYVMGDADGDSVLDRLPPSSLSAVVLNVTEPPPKPHLSWKFVINDGSLRFTLQPDGSMYTQIALYFLLAIIPIITATASVFVFMRGFYGVKFNEIGISGKVAFLPVAFRKPFQRVGSESHLEKDPRVGVAIIPPKSIPHAEMHQCNSCLQKCDALTTISGKRKTILIATMEYDIEDWAIKVKIGGLGVMAQLMGKNLSHQDLIWVVPCVGGIEYPVDEPADSMTVTVMGTEYPVAVQYHKLRNITYVLLDAPVFRQQTKADPYPARMDDIESAIFYSAWNQCISQALIRFPIDLYHINDYHGTIAPLYLLPKAIPTCLSLHNAEFQGLWPMRTKAEREEVCSVFNLPAPVVAKFVQYGEIFNLLHAGASLLRVYQEGFGAVGVSKKYGDRAYARYPIFWGLKKVQGLPNPDPTDTGEWDKKLPREEDMQVDPAFEKERLDHRIEAQKWAGLEENPNAELFVFVGRWSMQKGVDLIADVFPSILESKPNVQLICVGPVIDLYGKFAALKLDRLMKMYPKRVFSKPEFTALPPYIFSGAEFALIPSRDEPFGLVAVEFGRKGALGVGARVGGLGQMPGWWFTVESMTTSHLLLQFREAIYEAMSSPVEARAKMRARSAKQRFPVAQWVEDLGILQSTCIRIFNKVRSENKFPEEMLAIPHQHTTTETANVKPSDEEDVPEERPTTVSVSAARTVSSMTASTIAAPKNLDARPFPFFASQNHLDSRPASSARTISSFHSVSTFDSSRPGSLNFSRPRQTLRQPGISRRPSLGSRRGPGHVNTKDYNDGAATQGLGLGQNFVSRIEKQRLERFGDDDEGYTFFISDDESIDSDDENGVTIPESAHTRTYSNGSSDSDDERLPWPLPLARMPSLSAKPSLSKRRSITEQRPKSAPAPAPRVLSIASVVGQRTNLKLQKVDPFFTDSSGYFTDLFKKRLETLDDKNSETAPYCIEEFLTKSEKEWFNDFRNAKLGRHTRQFSMKSNTLSVITKSRPVSSAGSDASLPIQDMEKADDNESQADEFLLGKDYKPPVGIRKWMQVRVLNWPLYAYFMALGQIIAANSYQITLLTGEVGQTASKLYVIASIYLITSACWWFSYRRFASVLSLSLPFCFYGLAFLFVGLGTFASGNGRYWIQNVGTGFYSVASSSGFLFFALNFGDEGGAHVKSWVWRACLVQGTQQIYVVALWYWGSVLTRQTAEGVIGKGSSIVGTWKVAAVTLPIAVALWAVGLVMWFGLPNYYRQVPGKMPSFYRSILKRKVVLWFFLTAVIQNFFLSAPYGRNWSFLFSSQHAKAWEVLILVAVFFVVVWAAVLWLFAHLSKSHSWILPLFAIGLGAPRWAQIWWGTSNIGLYLPWAGGFTCGALVSRGLWLWLGVLDAIQGVGFGFIILSTLTRVHVAFAVMAAQVLGSIATIMARAAAPNRIGPGPISPDISGGISKIWQAWFWIGLLANLLICAGFYKFYRKEQLLKP